MNKASRLSRKKEKTRKTLIDAARTLVPEKQGNKISIQDITDKADVGLGTFYNYFTSKHKIYEAVLEDIRAEFQDHLDSQRLRLKDPAMIIAFSVRLCFQENLLNEEWKDFISYSGLYGDYYLEQNSEQCYEDVQRGVNAGRFKVKDISFAQNLIQGMLRHVCNEMRTGRMGHNAIDETTACILRMLGLPDVVARAVVQTHLPPVAVKKRELLIDAGERSDKEPGVGQISVSL